MTGPLTGRVALVAGGAGAVGEGVVAGLLAAGADVVVPSRDPARLDALAARLEESSGLSTVVGDLGDPTGVAELRDRVLAEHGRLDAVVAALGRWWQGGDLVEVEEPVWRRVLDNNLTTHFLLARTFLPVLADRPGASYLFVNGDAAEVPVRGAGLACIAAAGQLMLMRTLAAELAERQVRVNALVLGPVITRSRPTGPPWWITAGEVGAFAAQLASDAGAMVSGTAIHLPGRPPAGEPG